MGQPAILPAVVEPMLAVLGGLPHDPEHWGFEYKWDGFRSLCFHNRRGTRFQSRNLLDLTPWFPELAGLAWGGQEPLLLDGEIVALNAQGRPDFNLLQRRMRRPLPGQAAGAPPVRSFVFDVLGWRGEWVGGRSYAQRRALLEDLARRKLAPVPPFYPGQGRPLLQVARSHGLEGVMAKRLDSVYQPGRRSADWIKIKIVHRQAMVVGGWTAETSRPDRIGALLLGVYDDQGRLHYAGRVGTGFQAGDHAGLRRSLEERRIGGNPFAEKISGRGVRFVKPDLVAEIAYRRWPAGGHVQAASYQGLRADKTAQEVRREQIP